MTASEQRAALILLVQHPNILPILQRGRYQRDQADAHEQKDKLACADEMVALLPALSHDLKEFENAEAKK
jgi:outer membrane PBP1 activator LpoA protein